MGNGCQLLALIVVQNGTCTLHSHLSLSQRSILWFCPTINSRLHELMATNCHMHTHTHSGPHSKLIKWVSAHNGQAKHANKYKFSSGACTMHNACYYLISTSMKMYAEHIEPQLSTALYHRIKIRCALKSQRWNRICTREMTNVSSMPIAESTPQIQTPLFVQNHLIPHVHFAFGAIWILYGCMGTGESYARQRKETNFFWCCSAREMFFIHLKPTYYATFHVKMIFSWKNVSMSSLAVNGKNTRSVSPHLQYRISNMLVSRIKYVVPRWQCTNYMVHICNY